LLGNAFNQRGIPSTRIGRGQEVDDLLTLLFKPKVDVNYGDLEILPTAQSKGSTCRGGSRTENKSVRHNLTQLLVIWSCAGDSCDVLDTEVRPSRNGKHGALRLSPIGNVTTMFGANVTGGWHNASCKEG